MATNEIDHVPFIPARFYTNASRRKGDIRVIVIHDMEAPEKSTTAEAVARWWNGSTSSRSSAHYCIDNDSTVRSVKDEDVAWHAPGVNHDGIGLEMAGYARQTRAEWLDAYSKATMERTADVAAQLCIRYGINVKHLSDAELRAGHSGLIGHVQASNVYKKSSHWDPGPNFPWDYFMERVRFHYSRRTGGTRRYSMVIYGKRGTPDYSAASAGVDAANTGVATASLAEAKAAVQRGEVVIAVGSPAANDLGFRSTTGRVVRDGNKFAAVGSDGLQSLELVAAAIRQAR